MAGWMDGWRLLVLTWVVVNPVPSASSRFSRGDGYGLCVYQSRNTDLDFSCTTEARPRRQWRYREETRQSVSEYVSCGSFVGWSRRPVKRIMRQRVSSGWSRSLECARSIHVCTDAKSYLKTITRFLPIPNGARQGELPPNAVFANCT